MKLKYHDIFADPVVTVVMRPLTHLALPPTEQRMEKNERSTGCYSHPHWDVNK